MTMMMMMMIMMIQVRGWGDTARTSACVRAHVMESVSR